VVIGRAQAEKLLCRRDESFKRALAIRKCQRAVDALLHDRAELAENEWSLAIGERDAFSQEQDRRQRKQTTFVGSTSLSR
jgi:hypothetical protein